MAELNSKALSEVNNTFLGDANALKGIKNSAKDSPFLAGLINKFVEEKQGKFVIGPAGCGTYTSSDGKIITIDPTHTPSNADNEQKLFAVKLANELGHAVLPGGLYKDRDNIDDNLRNTRNAEGVAVASEYIVSKQLGLSQTHSDNVFNTDVVFLGLENSAISCSSEKKETCFAKDKEGYPNLTGITPDSPEAKALTKVNPQDDERNTSNAVISGGNDYMGFSPSTIPSLTYRQSSAIRWLYNQVDIADNVDWKNIKPVFEANPDETLKKGPDGSYSIAKGASLPLENGGRVDIKGNVSASGLVTIDAKTYDSSNKQILITHIENNPDGTSRRMDQPSIGDASTTTTYYKGRNGSGDPIDQIVERKPTALEQGPGQIPDGGQSGEKQRPAGGKGDLGSRPNLTASQTERHRSSGVEFGATWTARQASCNCYSNTPTHSGNRIRDMTLSTDWENLGVCNLWEG